MKTKLCVGAGHKLQTGEEWINLDIVQLPGIDVVCDIEKVPLPFADNQFDEILCEDVLEHTEYTKVLKELHRILKPGGKLIACFPHWSSANFWIDPSHKHAFSIRTMGFFVRNNPYIDWEVRKYYYNYSFARMEKSKITFPRHYLIFKPICELLFNLNAKVQTAYELFFFARIFPAENVEVTVIK